MEVTVRQGVAGRRLAPLACGCAMVVAGTYVTLNDPAAAGSRFPPCAFRQLTGLWCPGCGLTRGVHHLLGGDVAGALSSNVFTPVAVLLLVGGWWYWTRRAFGSPRRPPLATVPARWWIACAVTLVLYGVLRNIPAAGFESLAP